MDSPLKKLIKNILQNPGFYIFFSFFTIIFFLHINHPLNSDEGIVLTGAWDLLNGKKIYTDFFELVTPGAFYAIFFTWKLFGPSYASAKIVSLLALFFSAIGVHWITQKIYPSENDYKAYIPPLIFIFSSIYWPIISYHTFNLLFIIWATYFYLKTITEKSMKYPLLAGLFTGGAILFSHNKGIVLFLALTGILTILFVWQKKFFWLRQNLLFILFSLLPLAILFIYWSPRLLYENLFVFPFSNYTDIISNSYLLLYLFLGFLFLTAWLLKSERLLPIWILIGLQLGLLISSYPLPDHYHIVLIIFPLYCLLPCTKDRLKNLRLIGKILTSGIIWAALVIVLFPAIMSLYYSPITSSIKNSDLLSYIRDNCRESSFIYAGPFMPGLYFETRKMNPTPYSWLITNHHTKEQFQEATEYLEKNQPGCAIMNYKMVEKYKYDRDNPVDNYINNNYRLVKQINNSLIFQRL